jgi:hypothetical protein
LELFTLKKLVEEKAKQLSEFLEKEFKGKVISEAEKYTIDSIVEDRFRILVAHLKEPVPKENGGKGLAEFNVWSPDEELLLDKKGVKYPERGEIANLLRISADELTERQVFVRIHGNTFNITEQVREVSKQIYTRLVERELRPSSRREGF